jgi:putative component of toxin-antitoxin plasmid stabilization module
MSKFALKEYNNVTGKIKFFKLIEDKICYWDDFCREIQKGSNLEDQLITIISRMNDIANLRILPAKKFKDITPGKETIKEYEIKTNDLRVYYIKDNSGNLVIIAGKKNSQPEDIKRFRAIKRAYLNSINK